MLESHLKEGQQAFNTDLNSLKFGVSITDACISWETTEKLILEAHEQLEKYNAGAFETSIPTFASRQQA